MKYTPHGYQKKAVRFMVERACAGLFLSPGLGKTSTTLAAFQVLRKAGLVKRMLVVAPLRPARSVWPGEVAKWDDFRDLRVRVLHGPGKSLDGESDIDVINYEGLEWLFNAAGKELPWEMLVADESTKLKCSTTKRFKTLRPHLCRFRRRYILTGTPAPNGLLDLFGQAYVLDMGNALGRFITHYRNQFFDSVGYGGFTWVPRDGAEKRIYERLRPLVLRLDAEDLLELPPLTYNTVRVELPPAARRAYSAMEDLLIAAVNDEVVTAANVAASAIKCRQIAAGGIYRDGEPDKWLHLHDAKTEAVAELVEELSGKPALVAYEFRHDLERLRKALGKDTPHLGGGVSAKEQARIEAAWNAGELPVLLAQPQSVAHGLNLQGTNAAVIWHSLTWNLEDYEQFIRRVWRQGQTGRVVVHHVVASKTVDEVILSTLRAKDRTQRTLLDALKAHARGRKR